MLTTMSTSLATQSLITIDLGLKSQNRFLCGGEKVRRSDRAEISTADLLSYGSTRKLDWRNTRYLLAGTMVQGGTGLGGSGQNYRP